MTGMKEGAGEDPFADDPPSAESESGEEAVPEEPAAEADSSMAETQASQTQQSQQSIQIPYKFRRDGVQDGRNRVPLFLQGDTKSAEREALRELEERFDADVSLTDLREALVKVGLQHLDEVEHEMEQWGYGMTFED